MKKTLLGLFAALALFSFAAPARAEGEAAGGDKGDAPKKEKKAKKGKKAKEGDAGGDAAGGEKK